jgi:hypothetical protein
MAHATSICTAECAEANITAALAHADLAPEVKQLLTLRLDGAHAAVDKLATLRRWLDDDGRIRHVYRYHGAMPGRFTSLGVQMQNLKKPAIEDIAGAIAAVRTGSLAHMRSHYNRPLAIIGDLARANVISAPGHRLFIADLSGIESRGLAWLCNEQKKLADWREFDRTGERDPYSRFGTEDLKLDGSIARKIGKTADLAFGYQGALGAWRRMAPADDNTPDEQVYENGRAWIRRHPNIAKFWTTSIRQAVNAIESKEHERFTAARIAFQRDERFLNMELPCGRKISYPFARVYADERGKTFTFRDASGGRWQWYHLLKRRGAFGGLIAENATQAICRDVFVEAMLRLEAAGYPIVAHLHDEFVCEVPNEFGNLDEFIAIITQPPAWALDFPIAAKGRISYRLIEINESKKEIAEEIGVEGQTEVDDEIPVNDGDEPIDTEDDIETPPPSEVPLVDEPRPAFAAAIADPPSTPPPPPPEDYGGSPWEDDPPPRSNGRSQGKGFAADGFRAGDGYSSGERPRGAPTTRYVYKDARGLLFMRVTRTSAKSFPTHRWEDGRWVSGWPATVIPYRLPELLAAPANEPVWTCEGEKDADNVAALGLITTTNPGGAKVWQPELAQWFKGKQLVYILEDNDDAGRAHTAKITAALNGVVPTIVVVSFPELPEKGDVSDWLEAGGNRKLLIARAEQARKRN